MSWLNDFKSFAFKGNAVDLAIAVIIGGAFGKIVSGLVDQIIMPLVSVLLPSGDWRSAGWVLRAAPNQKDAVVVKYGAVLGNVLDFLIVALVMFLVVSKLMKAVKTGTAKTTDDKPDAEKKDPAQA
jgi:large conductance mechanosensitive channel